MITHVTGQLIPGPVVIVRTSSVVTERAHERTVSEFSLDSGGIRVGEPLRQFRGVLTGVPIYDGQGASLMKVRP